MAQIKKWAMKTNNFMMLGQKIISLAEQSEIMSEYTTLNDDFKKKDSRMKIANKMKKKWERNDRCWGHHRQHRQNQKKEEGEKTRIKEFER